MFYPCPSSKITAFPLIPARIDSRQSIPSSIPEPIREIGRCLPPRRIKHLYGRCPHLSRAQNATADGTSVRTARGRIYQNETLHKKTTASLGAFERHAPRVYVQHIKTKHYIKQKNLIFPWCMTDVRYPCRLNRVPVS